MEALIREADALSLPCFDLVPAQPGDTVAAHWGGRRADLPEQFPEEVTAYLSAAHLPSVDDGILDLLGLKLNQPLVLSMWTTDEEDEVLRTPGVPTGKLAEVAFENTIPLTARPAVSLPPWEALLLYGGPAVQEWMAGQGLERWEYAKADFAVRESYLDYFNPKLPLLMDEQPYARVGGWHVIWPEDDYYIPREMRLMVWTFKNAEPWYEVFCSPGGNIVIKSRIT